MTLFPFFEDIDGKQFLIIGGGKVAAGKVSRLLPFTEDITVIAPETEIQAVGKMRILRRAYVPKDLVHADVVTAAADLDEGAAGNFHSTAAPGCVPGGAGSPDRDGFSLQKADAVKAAGGFLLLPQNIRPLSSSYKERGNYHGKSILQSERHDADLPSHGPRLFSAPHRCHG